MRSPRPRTLALLALAAVLAAAAAAWHFAFRDSAEPASLDDVVEAFRARAEREGSIVPAGVYVYETRGHERVDALGGARHAYPSRSSITATRADCGTLLRWDVLVGRSTEWVYCDADDHVLLASVDERHRFFGNTETTTYACDDTVAFPRRGEQGDTWPVRCDAGEISERGTGAVVGRDVVVVGAVPVSVLHVRVRTTFTGPTRGSAVRESWVEPETGLPVRLRMVSETTNATFIGDVHYEEDVTLELTSLEPRR